LSQRRDEALASIKALIDAAEFEQAREAINTVDLVVYGYGQPEFDALLSEIDANTLSLNTAQTNDVSQTEAISTPSVDNNTESVLTPKTDAERAEEQAIMDELEQAKLAVEKRLAEQQRLDEQAKADEEARLAEEARIAEAAEQDRLLEEALAEEQKRIAEEAARAAAEEEARVAEELARAAEQARVAEAARLAEIRRAEQNNAAFEPEPEQEVTQRVTDEDIELAWRNFNSLKRGIESQDMQSILSVSKPSGAKIQMLLQLFQNYDQVNLRLDNVSSRSRAGIISGVLRIESLVKKGRVVEPPRSHRENAVKIERTQQGWSPVLW